MEHRLKIRVEIGPGIPKHVQPIKDPDGFTAMIRALAEVIIAEKIPAGSVFQGTSGHVTAHVSPIRLVFTSVPVGTLDTSFIKEVEFTVRVEGTPANGNGVAGSGNS
jgi:hypothetical protein